MIRVSDKLLDQLESDENSIQDPIVIREGGMLHVCSRRAPHLAECFVGTLQNLNDWISMAIHTEYTRDVLRAEALLWAEDVRKEQS